MLACVSSGASRRERSGASSAGLVIGPASTGTVSSVFSSQLTDGVLRGDLLDNSCQTIDKLGYRFQLRVRWPSRDAVTKAAVAEARSPAENLTAVSMASGLTVPPPLQGVDMRSEGLA